MAERKSPAHQEEQCTVQGCGKEAERSVSAESATESGLDIIEGTRRAHLCKEHYKEFKKKTKKDRKLGMLGH